MTAAALNPTTTFVASVERHAKRMREIIAAARSRCSVKQVVEYAREVAKTVLTSKRSRPLEQVVALVIDLAQRGNLEDAEAVGLHLAAIARAEYAAARPEARQVQLSVAEAHIAAELAEGECDAAESRMITEPTLSNRMAFLAASTKLASAQRALDEAVRREVAAS